MGQSLQQRSEFSSSSFNFLSNTAYGLAQSRSRNTSCQVPFNERCIRGLSSEVMTASRSHRDYDMHCANVLSRNCGGVAHPNFSLIHLLHQQRTGRNACFAMPWNIEPIGRLESSWAFEVIGNPRCADFARNRCQALLSYYRSPRRELCNSVGVLASKPSR